MKELNDWIEKVERITSSSKVDSKDLIKVLEFLEEIDEENRHVLQLLHKNNTVEIEEVRDILQYYNAIPSDLPLSERKSKVFIQKGLFTKRAFDIFKYPMPEIVKETIERMREIYR